MQQVVEGFRLSQQQARLWWFQQQSNAYGGWCSVLIEGQLDVAQLQDAMGTVLGRHEIYRTRFHRTRDLASPLQVIHVDPLYTWRSIDLQNFEPHEQQRQIEILMGAEKRLVLDGEQRPLVLSTLLTLTEHTSLWFLRLSALCADAQTLQNLFSEVARLYLSAEEQIDDIIQYLQFSEWQDTLSQEGGEDERAFWLKQDLSAFFSVSLPCRTKTNIPHSFTPDVVTQPLRIADAMQLDALLDHYQCTLPTFVLTCWFALLWKLTGRDEILVGLSTDGRIDDSLQNTAGPLAKCLPLLCSLKSKRTLKELFAHVQDKSDELYSLHPYFSWDKLEGSVGLEPFSCLFGFEWRECPDPFVAGAISFSLQHWESYSEPFHVKLVVVQGPVDLTLQFQFDHSRFYMQDIQRISEQFSALVERLIKHPDQPLETLDILSVAERQQLLVEFNQTEVIYPHDLCLHQMIEQQVALTPDTIAVESEQGQLTYEHLNHRANQLAHYLRDRGVGPDVLVGIGLERSIEFVIGLLGILKAGGAYLPLDLSYPEERLSFMVTDAQADILLTKHTLLETLPRVSKVVLLDADWPAIAQESGEKAESRVASSNLAYVIYTSGSTGVPKGVMVTHQGLGNLGKSQIQAFQVHSDSRVLQFASLSFDASVSEFVMALLAGATLCLFPAPLLLPGPDLLSVFYQYQITHVTLPPSALMVLPIEPLSALQCLVVAGEASSMNILTRWMGQRIICNAYGPTETTVCATIATVNELSPLTIGRPLSNIQIYLLDAYLCPVPLGTPGELYIGGVGVGRGYLNRPDLTAERFIAHPFSKKAGARLYKTGDLARYVSADGTLEYLRRLDTQIKLRGYRIEITEIETVLRQQPQVLDCAILLQEDGPAAPRLVAYVVARKASGSELIQETFREMLRNILPEYMVPSIFILLDTLPLTPNGKVDRRKLPVPEQVPEQKTWMLAETRSPLEEILFTIWKDLLDLPSLSIQDNFFGVGGHSLLATQLIAHVRAVLQVELPVQTIFDAPTIAKFASRVEQALRQGETSSIPPLVAGVRPDVLPLSFAQQRLWFLEQLDPGNTAYLLPNALRISGEIEVHDLERALEDLIHRHEGLRTTFTQRDGQPIQVIHPVGPLRFPLIDFQRLGYKQAEVQMHQVVAQEAQHPIDLVRGPLVRTVLLRLDKTTHILLLTLHHIITDGWSNSILVREFTMLYQAVVSGASSPLAPLPLQYADYALWQREWLRGDVLEAQLGYWRTQLAAEVPLELPTDHPRPMVQMYRGTVQSLQLSSEFSEQLALLSRQQNVTLFMLLLAAFQVLLARYTGQDDICVGTPIANRRYAELEGVVGFFLNTLVLRTDLSGDPTFEQVLQRVREVCLGAYAHQDIPFEKVVEELSPERNLSRAPLFQVLLVLQNTPPAQFELDERQIALLAEETTVSHFDLTFFLTETEQGLECDLEYDTDLFEEETIIRLLGHWQMVLEGVVQMPQMCVSEVPLLTAEEREHVLREWNMTQKAYPQTLCMHQLFEEQVQRIPDAMAVVCYQEGLTYQALNRHANQLAHYLQQRGVRSEMLVGVCMERSVEWLLALLALLKTGGVYVPLDPSYPADRLAWIAEDAQFLLLLTQADVVSTLHWAQVPLLCVDTQKDLWSREPGTNLENQIKARHLVYSIYTSGSTGRPKGAMIEQEGMLNHLYTKIDDLALTSVDRIAQTASLSFDISVWQLLVGLLVGGCTIIYDRAIVADPLRLIKHMQRDQISIVEVVPSFLQVLLESVGTWSQHDRNLPSLRWLVPTGEALSPALCRRWFATYPAIPLLNAYGPTECSDDVASYALIGSLDQQGLQVPIGRPVHNIRLYVLDRHLRLLPVGIAGELFVCGVGVGRGYLNNTQRTAEVFIPDPFVDKPGQRMYRTGDRVRWLRGGTLEFLGRMDQQVKIRGFRIELGEIEAVMEQHPVVRECVVLAQDDPFQDKRLVAYVVPRIHKQQENLAPALLDEQMAHWQMIFNDQLERQSVEQASDPIFNLAGWNSSYTREAIPADEMAVWVESTVSTIRQLRPRRVLEIGCGTGLLLFRLAPDCESYWGTDFSEAVIHTLHQQLERPEYHQLPVKVFHRAADKLQDLPRGYFDLVILNSVVQYFPDVSYLLRVLHGALPLLTSDGHLFLGDIRSLPLLEAYHTSVQLALAPASLDRGHLLSRVHQHVQADKELVLDPAFFEVLVKHEPELAGVQIFPKRGWAHNELTQFRYQVVLWREKPFALSSSGPGEILWQDWHQETWSLSHLEAWLSGQQGGAVGVHGIPNARLQEVLPVQRWLQSQHGPMTVGGWHEHQGRAQGEGVEPEAVIELGERLGYKVELSWRRHGAEGSYEAIFWRGELIEGGLCSWKPELAGEENKEPEWQHYANQPLQEQKIRTLLAPLRPYLQERLPDYLIPAVFVPLSALPLNANGKVDRRALQAPEVIEEETWQGQQQVRTPLEELLLGLWCEVLGRQQIGLHDNFFALGGHSLLATQLVVRLRVMLAVEIPLRAVFEEPTPAGLARQLEQVLRKHKGIQMPPLIANVRPEVLPLSFAQQRLWFLDQLKPGSSVYLLPDALCCAGSLSIEVLERSLSELIRRHESLRTTFVGIAGQPVQVIHPASNYCLPVIDLQRVREDERTRITLQLAEQEAENPCDLAVGPLLRVYVLCLQKQDHRVFITLHHIITDGWSSSVFVGELTTLYQAFITNHPSPLEPLLIHYGDYALWQQEWLQGKVLESLLDYWTKQLRGASALELPTDRPKTANLSNRGAVYTFKIPSSLYNNVVTLSRQEGVTLFMTMLTAFQILLHHYTGKRDIVVGTDIANRTFTETEKMIGFFVNLLALRMRFSDQATFRETLKSVRTMMLDVYAHQDLPFEKLIDALQLERNTYQVPLINVLFVMQNVPQYLVELPGLTLSSMDTQATSAKFDVALFLMEEEQELTGYVNYRTDLFHSESIARFVRLFEEVLEDIVAAPDTIVGHLGIKTKGGEDKISTREVEKYKEERQSKLKMAKRQKVAIVSERKESGGRL